MGFRQITRLPSTSGAPRTLPGSYPPALSIGPDLGEAGRSRRLPGHWPPDASSDVLAMALAEPGRAQDGAGAVIPGYGHVSMVFVHPDIRGRGLGRQLLQGLHEGASDRGSGRTTPWTRASNVRARRLYEGRGYRTSGRETTLGDGDPILHFERQAR
jgi:GNAT superfamily N-acetyltransferase